jgi:hypothetical protein
MSVPSAPIIRLAPRSSNQTLEFQWSPPASGSPITGYEIDVVGSGGGTFTTTGTYYKVTGLTNGTLYTATVRAQNTNGYGPTASFRPFAPGNGVPGQPATATAVSLDSYTSAMVSWTAPSSLPDSPIFWYVITSSSNNGSDPVIKRTANGLTQTSLKITGLNPLSTYTFNVQAVNCPGYGPARTTTSVGPPTKGSIVYSDGTDYLTLSSGITVGTNDYSLDFYFKINTSLGTGRQDIPIIGRTTFDPNTLFVTLVYDVGSYQQISFGTPISSQSLTLPSFTADTWYYLAITRVSNQVTLWFGAYSGGTAQRTTNFPNPVISDTTNYSGATGAIVFQNPPPPGGTTNNIQITNLRFQLGGTPLFNVNNTSIPIPTSPLTANGSTQLLLLSQDAGAYITNSASSGITLTANGTPTWSSQNPFP